MENYGLLHSMADGIKEGMVAYQTVSAAKQSQKQADRAFQMQKLKEGMQESPQGLLAYTPEREAEIGQERKAKGLHAQHEIGMLTSGSPESERAVQFGRAEGAELPEGTTAQEYKELGVSPILYHKATIKEQRDLADRRLADAKEERNYKREERAEKEAEKKSPEGLLKSMPTTMKARYDNVVEGSDAVDEMESALQNGENTFSVVGENNYTLARKKYAEALGRMQSGGAITKEEQKRFEEFAPKFTDSPEIQREKIRQARAQMAGRLKTMGFDEPVGAKRKEVTSPQEDKEAIRWAETNPKDPRAKYILKHHGRK